MSAPDSSEKEAGPPQADRLLIPALKDAKALQASRIDAPVRRLSGATMGTGWSLSFVAYDVVTNAQVVTALEETFAHIIRQMSGWEPSSDLCRFNRAQAGWHELTEDFFRVLTRALEIAELSDGAYNPTLGAVTGALGFGPALEPHPRLSSRPERSGEPGPTPPRSLPADQWVPDSAFGASGMTAAAWHALKLDPVHRLAYQPGAITLDLSSIAKGYAVDLCAERLAALDIASFLMEIGGEFVGRGVRPDAQPWRVELDLSDLPSAPGEPLRTFAALVNHAVATSGDFVRRKDGVHHLLDGRTQRPADNTLSGVAVLAETAMDADGWATALFALGPEEGLRLATARNLAAVLTSRTPEGARTALSPAAAAMLD